MRLGLREVWIQLINQALPGGLISAEEAADRLERARLAGR
jgi:hypothetical protein